jgi:hypothetical protein
LGSHRRGESRHPIYLDEIVGEVLLRFAGAAFFATFAGFFFMISSVARMRELVKLGEFQSSPLPNFPAVQLRLP